MSWWFMTPTEVARRYDISITDLRRDLDAGVAPSIKVGRGSERDHYRMSPEHVARYLEIKERQAAQAARRPEPVTQDPLRQAIAATRRRQARRTGHRPAWS